ncbi:hypothetical protein F2Q69_00010618 [Brassica cretica]|uniref:Neprosin PEP catalytic domain-containing protein n=2 Tax=Brassica cretica TaxID=69181 RepID=A0A8S9R3U3_BRACR|nr:hypothetical protein F2Q69_00010618 [Brassica cretica]
MSELSESVKEKRIELERLLRVKAVKEIVESQILYLEQWTTIEDEYSTSLSETSEALRNASLRLPLDADIKVETKELAEVLTGASKSVEGIVQNIGHLLPKTQEMEALISELARVSSIEKASVQDCGVTLLKTHSAHIEECYLRSQLIQQQQHKKRQERLEFLYDSGLAVGKGSASGSGVSFQREEQPLANAAEAGNNAGEKPDPSAPGALFEDKTPSANDSWRKLHSDPLLLIRQREQEALARIKNNPVKMALIRKSVEEKGKGKDGDAKEHKKKRKHRKHSSSRHHSDSGEDSGEETGRKSRHHRASGDHDKHYERESRDKHSERRRSDLEDESRRRESHDKHYERRRSELDDESKRRESQDKHYERRRSELDDESKRRERRRDDRPSEKYRNHSPYSSRLERENLKSYGEDDRKRKTEDLDNVKPPSREDNGFQNRRRKGGSKLSEEERAARFKQMQMDAEVHEEQRWRRLKKADESDAVEASKNKNSLGKSFLDEANKSVYGVEKGGSSTIEESSPDGDVIDCIPVTDQPALAHPLLINHTVQMSPSFNPESVFSESKVSSRTKKQQRSDITQLWHVNGKCPENTVPIRRTTKQDLYRASSVESFGMKTQKRIPKLKSYDTTGVLPQNGHQHAIMYVEDGVFYGAKAKINVWNPDVEMPNEFSLAQIWVLGGNFNSDLNSIEAGWQVSPQLYGDNHTRLFTYWTSDAYQGTGCYNLLCSGFVQINREIAMGGSISPLSSYGNSQYDITILIWKDPKEGHWWLQFGEKYIMGYWPASLFSYLSESASMIEWGGEVVNSQSEAGQHTTTQMGSGRFAEEGWGKASYFKNVQVVDGSNKLRNPENLQVFTDEENCYNVKSGNGGSWGSHFYYGGPGRNPNCP